MLVGMASQGEDALKWGFFYSLVFILDVKAVTFDKKILKRLNRMTRSITSGAVNRICGYLLSEAI